jgi:uncharacterized membrane protein
MLSMTQVLLIVLSPALFMWLEKKVKPIEVLGPVVICYIFGAALANFGIFPINAAISQEIVEASVPLSIPLLLFSTDFVKWLRMAKSTLLSFVIILVVVMVVSCITSIYFKNTMEDYWQVAGMLVGVYTGGTPNMSAIGLALDVHKETFLIMNAADLVFGGSYFFLAISVVHRFISKFLPAYKFTGNEEVVGETSPFKPRDIFTYIGILLFSGLILGASIGAAMLFTGKMNVTIIILGITSLGIAASFNKKIRSYKCSYNIGQYLLLVFCVGVGSLADISKLATAGSMNYFLFTAIVMYTSITLHFFFCWVFKIDRDTAMITSIAGIYGPAFVGPVCQSLKNREIIVSGLTSGLVGMALGNYLGIGLANFVKAFI